jgi:hypothetical protein
MNDDIFDFAISDFKKAFTLDPEWYTIQGRSLTWWPWSFSQRIDFEPPVVRKGLSLVRAKATTELYGLPFGSTTQEVAEIANVLNRAATLSAVLPSPWPPPPSPGEICQLRCCCATTLHKQALQINWRLMKVAASLQVDLACNLISAVSGSATGGETEPNVQLPNSKRPDGTIRTSPDEMTIAAIELCEQVTARRSRFWGTFRATKGQIEANVHASAFTTISANDAELVMQGIRCGKRITLQFRADTPHPRYGNGLLALMFLDDSQLTPAQAMRLNIELTAGGLQSIGFGAWVSDVNHRVAWNCFVPDFAFDMGVAPNLAIYGLRAAEWVAEWIESESLDSLAD